MSLLPSILASVIAASSTVAVDAGVDRGFITKLIDAGQHAPLLAEVLVAPDLRVEGCRVLSRMPPMATERVCAQARRMKAESAAVEASGVPVYGFVKIAVVPSGAKNNPMHLFPPDVVIGVEDLPGSAGMLRVSAQVLVDAQGSVSACHPEPEAPADFAAVACAELRKSTLPVVNDRAGQPVRYVSTMEVAFQEDA